MFRHNFQLHAPKSPQKTAVSIKAGATNPKNERQSDPKREMKSSKLGIATARPTVKQNTKVIRLRMYKKNITYM